MGNAQLQGLFRRYNRQYFGGKLSPTPVRFVKRLPNRQCAEWDENIGIRIVSALRRFEWAVKICLLHEMAHQARYTEFHGRAWHSEVARLWRQGAYKSLL